MSFPMGGSLAALLVAAVAAGMTSILLLRKGPIHSIDPGGAIRSHGSANFANGVGLLDEAYALFWRKIAMLGELAQPAALLYIGLAFLKPSDGRWNAPMLWPARIIGVAGIVLMVLTITGYVTNYTNCKMARPLLD